MIEYNELKPPYSYELNKALMLIQKVFIDCIAPQYSEEGVKIFLEFNEQTNTIERLENNGFMIIAKEGNNIIGVIEVKDYTHITRFFVDVEFQGQGIGRKLFFMALKKCMMYNDNIDCLSVNSSPNSVNIYEHLGFVKESSLTEKNGIKFMPMKYKL